MHADLKVMDEVDLDWMAWQGPVEETATKFHCFPSATDLLVTLCLLLQIQEKQPKWWRWLVQLWRGPSCKTVPYITLRVTDQFQIEIKWEFVYWNKVGVSHIYIYLAREVFEILNSAVPHGLMNCVDWLGMHGLKINK